MLPPSMLPTFPEAIDSAASAAAAFHLPALPSVANSQLIHVSEAPNDLRNSAAVYFSTSADDGTLPGQPGVRGSPIF